eukprot:1025409-Amphidinium_carterae.1
MRSSRQFKGRPLRWPFLCGRSYSCARLFAPKPRKGWRRTHDLSSFRLSSAWSLCRLADGQRQKMVTAIKNAAFVRTAADRLVVSAEAPIFDEVLALTSSKFQKSYGDGVRYDVYDPLEHPKPQNN